MLEKLENELKIRGFSEKTIDAYLLQNKLFLDYIKKPPEHIAEDDVKSYMAHLMTNKKQKPASISQMLSALRFYYHIILKKTILADIKTPKLEKKLPNFTYLPALSEPLPDDNWKGETGLITEVLDRHLTSGENVEAYVCGSPGMIEASIAVLTKKGIPEELIYYDKFG